MIRLTRLSGTVFALNSDLIERVDSTPDTVITLVDGTKYVVRETLDEVVAEVRAYRSWVIADSAELCGPPQEVEPAVPLRRTLSAVPSPQAQQDRTGREA